MSGGFGGGVHAVLGDFVDAAGGRFDALAVEMVKWDAAFANGVAFFYGFGDVGFGEGGGFKHRASGGQLRSECGRKGAACTVQGFFLNAVAG